MNILLRLFEPVQAYRALCSLWPRVKPWMLAGNVLEIEIRPERRTSAQNALLHALLTEIADQVDWAGKKRTVEVWKRLLTAAWLRARGESVELLPALDGHGIDVVFRPTSGLTKAECAELVTFIESWAADNGVDFLTQQEATTR